MSSSEPHNASGNRIVNGKEETCSSGGNTGREISLSAQKGGKERKGEKREEEEEEAEGRNKRKNGEEGITDFFSSWEFWRKLVDGFWS